MLIGRTAYTPPYPLISRIDQSTICWNGHDYGTLITIPLQISSGNSPGKLSFALYPHPSLYILPTRPQLSPRLNLFHSQGRGPRTRKAARPTYSTMSDIIFLTQDTPGTPGKAGIPIVVGILVGLVASFVQSLGECRMLRFRSTFIEPYDTPHAYLSVSERRRTKYWTSPSERGWNLRPLRKYQLTSVSFRICTPSSPPSLPGLTIQRKSHLENDARPPARQRKAHRRPLWLIGFAIFISSNLFGTIFQIGALPIVILAPLGAVSLLWNAVLSRILLGDFFTTSTLLGTFLIALGATLIAIFGVVPEENHNLAELLQLFKRPGFVVYITLMSVAVSAVLVIVSG